MEKCFVYESFIYSEQKRSIIIIKREGGKKREKEIESRNGDKRQRVSEKERKHENTLK